MDTKLIALLATLSLALVAFNPSSTQVSQFENYKAKYGKSYTAEEESFRFAAYL